MGFLKGKKIVVTGGSSGIGRETALTLAREGADVLITFNTSPESAGQVLEEIRSLGCSAYAFQVDVRNEQQVLALAQYAKTTFGNIDVLINNAGIYTYNSAVDTSPEQWDLNVDVNLKGTFLVSQAFGKHLFIPQQKGKIINMASFVGILPVPGLVAYNVAKAGIIHLTKQLAMEWGKYNLEVICVSPGYVATEPMLQAIERGDADGPSIMRNSPIGRLAEPQEVANLFLMLCSDKIGYISGTNIVIDGAYTSGIRFSRLENGEILMD